jgi:hypothetical protein
MRPVSRKCCRAFNSLQEYAPYSSTARTGARTIFVNRWESLVIANDKVSLSIRSKDD